MALYPNLKKIQPVKRKKPAVENQAQVSPKKTAFSWQALDQDAPTKLEIENIIKKLHKDYPPQNMSGQVNSIPLQTDASSENETKIDLMNTINEPALIDLFNLPSTSCDTWSTSGASGYWWDDCDLSEYITEEDMKADQLLDFNPELFNV